MLFCYHPLRRPSWGMPLVPFYMTPLPLSFLYLLTNKHIYTLPSNICFCLTYIHTYIHTYLHTCSLSLSLVLSCIVEHHIQMEWNHGNLRIPPPPPLVPPFITTRPDHNSFSFLYNCHDPYDPFQGTEMKQQVVGNGMEKSSSYGSMNNMVDKKKRLTSDQLDSLESSFQQDTKLEPDRKIKLAQELGLHPRQVAVWFQNRRARWKAKQLEHLYDTLKHQYDVVSNQKQKLQQEVVALRAILKEQVIKNQVVSGGYTEISGEETVESTSAAAAAAAAVRISSSKLLIPSSGEGTSNQCQNMDDGNYAYTVDDFNPVVPPAYWAVLPSYPMN